MNSICKKYNFQNNAGKARIIIAIIAIAIMLIGLIIFLVGSFLPQIPQNGTTMINSQPMWPWFGFLGYLTIQSGIIYTTFLILWLVNMKKNFKFMKSNLFQICACTYATMVFILYNGLLLPAAITDPASWDYFSLGRIFWWIYNMCVHTFGPLLVVAFFILSLNSKKEKRLIQVSYKNTILIGLIFPVIYFSYLVIVFFAFHISVYDSNTAFWNFNDIKDSNMNQVDPGNWINLFMIPVGICSYFGILSLYKYLDKKYCK